MRRWLTRLGLLLFAQCVATSATAQARQTRQSGFEFMSPATQALQAEDAQNPAFLWLKGGEQRFAAACARCHRSESLRGVAARYPAWDAMLGKPVTLSARINLCRVRQLKSTPWAAESDALLEVETYVAHQSRGQPIVAPSDARLAPFLQQGARLYAQRMGQLDFSCAQCHDGEAGRRLAGSLIPQAHPTGYPIYRLEWQAVGSLQRRLRQCMSGVRAEPFAYGSDELTALEMHLNRRAAGMLIETPAVRP